MINYTVLYAYILLFYYFICLPWHISCSEILSQYWQFHPKSIISSLFYSPPTLFFIYHKLLLELYSTQSLRNLCNVLEILLTTKTLVRSIDNILSLMITFVVEPSFIIIMLIYNGSLPSKEVIWIELNIYIQIFFLRQLSCVNYVRLCDTNEYNIRMALMKPDKNVLICTFHCKIISAVVTGLFI